jgi:hypothetical protein
VRENSRQHVNTTRDSKTLNQCAIAAKLFEFLQISDVEGAKVLLNKLQEADFPSGNERTLGKIKIAIFYSRFFGSDRGESFTGWWAVKWSKLS